MYRHEVLAVSHIEAAAADEMFLLYGFLKA